MGESLDSVSFEGNATCKSCDNYAICRGGCRARALNVYGDINAVDPICPLRKKKYLAKCNFAIGEQYEGKALYNAFP
jgi:sulfatase maturation enzyme AslB (radical SAM superfamily)